MLRKTRKDKGRKRGKRRGRRVLKKYPNTLVAIQKTRSNKKYKSQAKRGAELGAVSGATGALAKGVWERDSVGNVAKNMTKASVVGASSGVAGGTYLMAKNSVRNRVIKKARKRVRQGYIR